MHVSKNLLKDPQILIIPRKQKKKKKAHVNHIIINSVKCESTKRELNANEHLIDQFREHLKIKTLKTKTHKSF